MKRFKILKTVLPLMVAALMSAKALGCGAPLTPQSLLSPTERDIGGDGNAGAITEDLELDSATRARMGREDAPDVAWLMSPGSAGPAVVAFAHDCSNVTLTGFAANLLAQADLSNDDAAWRQYIRSSSVEMIIRLDGEIVWRSGVLAHDSGYREFEISLDGASKVSLTVTDGGDGIPTLEHDYGTGKGDGGVWGIWITPGGSGSTADGGSGQGSGATAGGEMKRVRFMNVLNDSARFVIVPLAGSGVTEIIVSAGPLGGLEGRQGRFAFGTYAVCAD